MSSIHPSAAATSSSACRTRSITRPKIASRQFIVTRWRRHGHTTGNQFLHPIPTLILRNRASPATIGTVNCALVKVIGGEEGSVWARAYYVFRYHLREER